MKEALPLVLSNLRQLVGATARVSSGVFFKRMQITQIQKEVTWCRKLRCEIVDSSGKKSRFAVQLARFRIGINLTIDKDDARELNQRFCVVRDALHLSTANNFGHIAATLYFFFLNLLLCFL